MRGQGKESDFMCICPRGVMCEQEGCFGRGPWIIVTISSMCSVARGYFPAGMMLSLDRSLRKASAIEAYAIGSQQCTTQPCF